MSDDRLKINFGDLSPECQQIIKDIFDKLEQIESIIKKDDKVERDSFQTPCTQTMVYQGWIKDVEHLSLSKKKANSLVHKRWESEKIKTYLTGFLYFFLIVANAFLYLFIL